MSLRIRPIQPSDLPALERCVIEMQDFERAIDPRLRPGAAMAAAYTAELRERSVRRDGVILVAEIEGAVAGFVAVQARVPYEGLDDPPGFYALVSDLAVLPAHRRKGLGRALLDAAEAHARARGAPELRIAVLAENVDAGRIYRTAGFRPYLEILSKPLIERPASRVDLSPSANIRPGAR